MWASWWMSWGLGADAPGRDGNAEVGDQVGGLDDETGLWSGSGQAILAGLAGASAQADMIRVQSTTDTVDAGLKDGLIVPGYAAAQPGDTLQYTSVGTGKALDNDARQIGGRRHHPRRIGVCQKRGLKSGPVPRLCAAILRRRPALGQLSLDRFT